MFSSWQPRCLISKAVVGQKAPGKTAYYIAITTMLSISPHFQQVKGFTQKTALSRVDNYS